MRWRRAPTRKSKQSRKETPTRESLAALRSGKNVARKASAPPPSPPKEESNSFRWKLRWQLQVTQWRYSSMSPSPARKNSPQIPPRFTSQPSQIPPITVFTENHS
ncbi:GPI-anchored wall transfer protein 1 [Striga asiatica]|uniref:GPI-anchored wall transfer protein 1 n=1 Tax=Striga asiatica TaxID=4170 RepID=A0A5A7PZN1_STRAF|nr:GPI-anchored wall transfer protein 1 [Striga asiatica]